MGSNPDHKKRADGRLLGDKASQRQAKQYKATGKVSPSHRTVGKGAQELGGRRIWKWLFGDDES